MAAISSQFATLMIGWRSPIPAVGGPIKDPEEGFREALHPTVFLELPEPSPVDPFLSVSSKFDTYFQG